MWPRGHKYPESGEDGQGEVISSDEESPELSIGRLKMIAKVKAGDE